MDPLETQLRRHIRSLPAWFGAACTSALLFVAMASTSIVSTPNVDRPERPLAFAYLPPPPPPPMREKNRPPVATGMREAFKFDPTTAGPPPTIPLEMLDINLDPAVNPGTAIEMDMARTFEVEKPEPVDHIVIFDRDQVDELPVWLYGPQPRIPSRFDKTDWKVSVLYVVTDKGRTENIFVLDSTNPELNAPVKEAIADWRFRPARKDGRVVRVWVQQPVTYIPENKSPFSL